MKEEQLTDMWRRYLESVLSVLYQFGDQFFRPFRDHQPLVRPGSIRNLTIPSEHDSPCEINNST